jgi:hypothetical protein
MASERLKYFIAPGEIIVAAIADLDNPFCTPHFRYIGKVSSQRKNEARIKTWCGITVINGDIGLVGGIEVPSQSKRMDALKLIGYDLTNLPQEYLKENEMNGPFTLVNGPVAGNFFIIT